MDVQEQEWESLIIHKKLGPWESGSRDGESPTGEVPKVLAEQGWELVEFRNDLLYLRRAKHGSPR